MKNLMYSTPIKTIFSFGLLVFILATMVVVPVRTTKAAVAAGTTVGISPAVQTVTKGGTITFNIVINTTAACRGWQADLFYDANAMSFGSITEGSFLPNAAGAGNTYFNQGTVTYGVGNLNLSSGGSGYTDPLTVTFSGGGTPSILAKATAHQTGGVIDSITLTDEGTGYTSAPTIAITGGVGKLNLTNGGSGYTDPLTVAITGGGATRNATATAYQTNGVITSIILNDAGSGYTSVPTVTITGGSGSGATASATIGGNGSGATITPTMVNMIQAFAEAWTGGVKTGGATGQGTLCTITMTAKNTDILTDLTLVNLSVDDPSATPIPGVVVSSGQVIIGAPQLTITGFTPTSAGAGDTLTITGTNLNDATQVKIGGATANILTDTSTQITATVGNAANGSVSVTNALGTATASGSFTFLAYPKINSFTPTTGGTGTSVVISGANFTGTTAVSFGGTAAASFNVDSAGQITAIVGSGASGSVSVTTPGSLVATLSGFIYTPLPIISSFAPTIASAGQTITITGVNLSGATTVSLGGTAAAGFTVNSATQITAIVGNGSSGAVSVTTPNGTNTKAGFVFAQPPTITTFTPTSGHAGDQVTINGTNLDIVTAVTFGGTAATNITVISPTQITAVVGNGSSGAVGVVSPGGTTSAAGFTYTGLLDSITFFTPASAHAQDSVMIIGTNLSGATQVKFGTDAAGAGGTAGTIISNSTTEIVTTVNSGAVSGYVSVVTPLGTTTKSGFTYLPPSNTSVTAVPSTLQIQGGNQFTVDLVMNTQTPFLGWQGQITFDATKLQCLGITEGNILKNYVATNGGTEFSTTPLIDNNNGIVSNISYSINNPSTSGPSGKGTLCTLTFIAIPNSSTVPQVTCVIAPANIIVGGSSGQIDSSSVAGDVSIINPDIPAWDVNMDGVCNILDVIKVGLKWGATGTPGWTREDVNSDGVVNILDIVAIGVHWNETDTMNPAVSGFAPTTGKSGDTIIITGSNLSGATAVSFGGTAAQSFLVNSATQITAIVGSGATGSVSVTTPGGTATLTGFTYSTTATTINSFTPTTAAAGATVTITGTGLTGATAVSFGGTAAASFNVVTATQITAVVGTGATGSVSVTTSGGTATLAGFTYSATAPTITSFSPTTAGAGASVTITGTNLTGATAVSLGGTAATSFNVVSATQIIAVVGTGTTGSVSVTTSGGTATLAGFTYSATAPTITSFTPVTATSGASVTIIGTNFTNASSVNFGGTAAQSFIVNSATQITAVVGTGSTGSVTVTVSGVTATLAGFTFVSTPVISSVVPASASNFAKVIINGSNLTGATAVKFGGVAAVSFILVNDQQIVAVVASGSVSGNVTVTGPGGTGTLSGFTYLTPSSTITLTATPSASSAAAGSQFTVDLAMNTASGFVGWGGEVDFDANKLQCTGVTAGTWLSNYVTTNGGNNFSQTPAIDNTKGIVNNISYGGINLSSSATGLTGQGVLCTLSFTVKTGATGTTTIQPVAIVLDDPAANQINNTAINGGTVTLTGGTQSAPTITSFTPITAGAGTSVTIAGTNLSNASAVSFGGIAATSYTVSSATQIIAVVGTGTTGSVSVTTPGGTATLAGFTFTSGGAPTITSFTPTTSGSSSTVVITGTNLTGATAVSFGGTAAASYAVNSATQIIAVVGTGTTGSVSVTTPGGTATLNGFTYSTTAPIITSFTPQACASGDTITITGTHLANATSVKTGTLANGTIGSAASITSNTDTQIVATVQASVTGYLSVTTSNGTANVSGFTYTGPVITSFTPTSGDIGTTVTITGTGLENVNSVQFGGASGPAGTITNKTSTQITVTVGNGASGTVYVSAAGGGTNYKDGFTFVPSGAGISFTAVPSATSVAAGQTFTIALNVADTTKAFLAWSADVNFDPNILTFNLSASTQGSFLENYATSHSGSVYSGTPTIDNTNGHVTGLNDSALGVNTGLIGSGTLYTMNFTVKAGATGSTTITLANVTLVDDHGSPGPYNILPATVTGCTLTIGGQGITSFTPTTATAGMSVTITGNGFLNASAVSFGGTAAASYTVSSATQIIAVVGTGTTGSVSVTTSSGTVFTLAGFTYTVPAITSFTPTSAGAGASVTITGIGFTSATAVKFGGTAAASYVVNSATQITAVVGTGSTGAVTVTTSGGTVLTLSGFTFGSLPVITSIVPSSVSNFAKVIINGSNLTGATAVKFGGVAAVSFILVNDQQIVAVVASGSVSGNVTVTGPGGTGTLSGFTYLTPSSTITLTATPSASSAAAGSQFTVDLAMNTASGFVGWGGEVDFDASKLQCTGVTAGTWLSGYVTTNSGSMYSQTPAIDNTKGIVNNISYGGINLSSSATGLTGQGVLCTLTFTVKAGATGTTTIQPINIVLSSAAANQINNTMVNAGTVNISSTSTTTTTSSSSGSPIITSFSPTSAKNGDSVVITGTNFTGTNIVVKFGGTNASSITVNSATQITAIVGNGASGLVSVTTSQGTATKDGFNYNAPDSTSTTTTTESTLTNTTTNTSISTTTTTPTITSQQNNTQTLDFKLSDVNSSGVLSDNYSQDQTQDSTGLTVRLSINKGTKLTDATGNSVTDITVAFANLPKTESSNIIPIQAYEFGPDGSTFNPAITITVPYDPAKLGDGVSASKLRVVYYSSNNAKWEYIDCKVDAKNQLIQWQTTHFTTFAIVATSGFQFSWNMFILVVGILMILGLLLLAIIKRDNLVVAYAGLRGNQRVPVKERNEPELSTNKQAMSVYSPTQTNSEKHIKTSLTRTEEEMFNTIEIDKGNVDCNEIGLVFEDADDGSKGKGPVRIKLGYNSKLGTDNVIKINLIKRAKDDE